MNYIYETINNFSEIKNEVMNFPLSILHINIRSLRKNFNALLTYIKNIINKTDLIILSETNITSDENALYGIAGFSSIFANREGRGGGIAIYVNENIKYSNIQTHMSSAESLRIDLTTTHDTIISVISIYRPPKLSQKRFLKELEENINNVSKKHELIVVGDMNIDIKKKNTTTINYLGMLSSHGLQCMVSETTRENFNGNTNTCIDHLFIRCNRKRERAYAAVITAAIADHYALLGCLDQIKDSNRVNRENAQGDTNVKLNNIKINQLVNETNWSLLINQSNNVNDIYLKFNEKFKDIYKKSEYISKKQTKKRNPHPWLNNEILKSCEIRDKLHKRWIKNKNNKTNENTYKTFNNKLNKKINHAKNEYNYNQFLQNQNNIRGTWQIINRITGKKIANVDETIKRNFPKQNVQHLTDKFAYTLENNVNNIIHACNVQTSRSPSNLMCNTIYMEEANEEEILNILKTLNAKKSPGIDGIRAIDIKMNAECLTPIITTLINRSLNDSVVPEILKTSIVRPIYKSGSKSDLNNYRPIAILSVIEKVLEEIVVRRLNSFLTKHKIISNNQFGFQRGKNINQLLGYFSNCINRNLNINNQCLALFIDFSKAFDTLPHEKLLNTLENCGIRGICLNWFKSYLNCRNYRVKIDNTLSSQITTNFGVPQGSKLGPILYIIYTNEMVKLLKHSEVFSYADDTAIIVTHKNVKEAEKIMQNEFTELCKWCHDNGLIINSKKTKLMHIRPRHIPNSNIEIKFHDFDCLHNRNVTSNECCKTNIELVESYKYLGVHLDHNFKWKIHIQQLTKKLRKSMFALYHLSNCSPFFVLKQAYFSLIESQLRHGITAWGKSKQCKVLQKYQNRLIKLLNKSNKTPPTNQQDTRLNANTSRENNLFKTLHILNIDGIYNATISQEFYNSEFLQRIRHSRNTRNKHNGKYHIPRHNNDYGKLSLEITLPTFLNRLPIDILNTNNKAIRGRMIKKYLLSY